MDGMNLTKHPYPSDLPGLTTLRFFAAIWVVLYHYVWWFTSPGAPTLKIPLIIEGGLGVDFFFLLSGFILTHAHLRQIRTSTLNVKQFLIKRLARIYPLHLATLLFFLALVIALHVCRIPVLNPERYDPVQLVLNIFLLQAWQTHDAGAWNFPSWSISAEWFAYLIFPALSVLLVVRLARVRAEFVVAVALTMLIVFWASAHPLLGVSFFELHSNYGWLRILPEFILGMAFYRLGTERRIPLLEHRLGAPLLILLAVALAYFHLELLFVIVVMILIMSVAENAR
jgi:peptidoglycan/LPS O-acetylase OafA/YrhL